MGARTLPERFHPAGGECKRQRRDADGAFEQEVIGHADAGEGVETKEYGQLGAIEANAEEHEGNGRYAPEGRPPVGSEFSMLMRVHTPSCMKQYNPAMNEKFLSTDSVGVTGWDPAR